MKYYTFLSHTIICRRNNAKKPIAIQSLTTTHAMLYKWTFASTSNSTGGNQSPIDLSSLIEDKLAGKLGALLWIVLPHCRVEEETAAVVICCSENRQCRTWQNLMLFAYMCVCTVQCTGIFLLDSLARLKSLFVQSIKVFQLRWWWRCPPLGKKFLTGYDCKHFACNKLTCLLFQFSY